MEILNRCLAVNRIQFLASLCRSPHSNDVCVFRNFVFGLQVILRRIINAALIHFALPLPVNVHVELVVVGSLSDELH
jgi:hypothetical protein